MSNIRRLCIVLSLLTANTFAKDERNLYIGIEAGYSVPFSSKIEIKNQPSYLHMKKSTSFGGHIGYEFDDNKYIELLYAYQPSYRLGISIPAINAFGDATVKANMTILALNYDFDEVYKVTPFVSFGAGIANISTNALTIKTPSNVSVLSALYQTQNVGVFHLGFGLNLPITDSVEVELATKFHITNKIKLNYTKLLPTPTNTSVEQTIGVARFTAGLNYALPI